LHLKKKLEIYRNNLHRTEPSLSHGEKKFVSFLEASASQNSENTYQEEQTIAFNLETHLMLRVTMSNLLQLE